MPVATAAGFPLSEVRQQLLDAFVRHSWLSMLHLHVGSQGMSPKAVVEGIERVWRLLLDINAARAAAAGGRDDAQEGSLSQSGGVTVLDIGGGLTVDFDSDEAPQVGPFPAHAPR